MWRQFMKIGIDAGGTLIKVAYLEDGARKFEKWPSTEIDQLIEKLKSEHAADQIFLTGGKAEYMAEKLENTAGTSIEFDATYRGLKILMEEQGIALDPLRLPECRDRHKFPLRFPGRSGACRRFRRWRRHPDWTGKAAC